MCDGHCCATAHATGTRSFASIECLPGERIAATRHQATARVQHHLVAAAIEQRQVGAAAVAGVDKRQPLRELLLQGQQIERIAVAEREYAARRLAFLIDAARSEERRVGTEGVSSCKSRWGP